MRLLVSVILALVIGTAAGLFVRSVMADATAKLETAVEVSR